MPQKSSVTNSAAYVVLTGIFTLAMLVYEVMFFIFMFSIFTHVASGHTTTAHPPSGFYRILILGIIFMPVSLALLAAYVVHIAKNARLDGSLKAMWVILILFMTPFSMAVYWYLQLWTPRRLATSSHD
ncbi:MAG TPA: hypothetical protein VMB52_06130 [Verrucomicrobiae bacterium]|nr:hypothetical protein [Verrucomicrobiae bacterium]